MQLHGRSADELARRHALERGVNSGQHDERGLWLRRVVHQSRQRLDPLRDSLGVGRDAVVRHAVPGGKAQHLHVGGEERNRFFKRGEAVRVARHVEQRAARSRMPRKLGEQQRIESFGNAAGDGAPALEQAVDRQGWEL